MSRHIEYRESVGGTTMVTAPAALHTDFGGWPAINDEFFDQDSGIITQLQHEAGLS